MCDVSILLATYNGAAHIAQTIKSVRAQRCDHSTAELVVINDGSTDQTSCTVTAAMTGAGLPIRIVNLPANVGKAAALNAGITNATGTLLVFIDDDIVPEVGWLRAHVAWHAAATTPVVTVGPVRYPAAWVRQSNLVRYREAKCPAARSAAAEAPRVVDVDYFAGGNLAIRKDMLARVGGFAETIRRAEDRELAIRLQKYQMPLWLVPGAAVTHYEQEVLSYATLRTKYQLFYRRDVRRLAQYHPDRLSLTCRWCLQRPDCTVDSWFRRGVKHSVRLAGRPWLGRMVYAMLERTDHWRWAYCRGLYEYAFLCMAIEALHQASRDAVVE
jgi:glycosyltransferase involved in cell wall biosynthesis